MDIFSFTTIILMLFIIIGAYLIFTNQTEGRTKIILIVAVLVCFIYVFMNLGIFNSYTESKSSPVDASIIQTVPSVDTTATSFSLSTWIYITDLNSATDKTIFSLTNPVVGGLGPRITLGPYNNEIIITYYTTPTTSQNLAWNTLNNLLTAYTTAKTRWITASNAERDASGNFFNDVSGSGVTAIGKQTGTTIATVANSTLRSNTNAAYVTLKAARAAYDGGTTGIDLVTINDTTYVETTSTTTYNTKLIRSTKPSTVLVSAIINDDISSNSLTGGGIAAYTTGRDSQLSAWDVTSSADEYSLEKITIKEISIQKWVNVVVTFGDNTVDTYINGKLVDSHVSTGTVQKVTTTANDTTLSWGGFKGYISSSRYYPTFLTPQEVWDIYKGGFSDNLMGNFLNQYSAKFTFSQNQVEKASFNIL